jgi:hypothetical protein
MEAGVRVVAQVGQKVEEKANSRAKARQAICRRERRRVEKAKTRKEKEKGKEKRIGRKEKAKEAGGIVAKAELAKGKE